LTYEDYEEVQLEIPEEPWSPVRGNQKSPNAARRCSRVTTQLPEVIDMDAVGTIITDRPPRRTVRALLQVHQGLHFLFYLFFSEGLLIN
jgi:hypothetical protein